MVYLDFRYYLMYNSIDLLVSHHYRLDAVDFNDLQDLELEDFEKQVGEQGK
jgi:hypothetical protein